MYDFTEDFRAMSETLFQSEFGILYPTIKVQWDDIPFDQPKDRWVAFTVNQNPAKQATIGNRFIVRTTGYIQIDVMVAGEKGKLVEAKKIAEAAADIFAYRKFKGAQITLSCQEKHVTVAPTAGSFRRVMARVFFYYDGERPLIPMATIP